MRKIVLTINENDYEKFRLEAIQERKSIDHLIRQRIFHKPFSYEVLQAFDIWMTETIEKILED